MESNHNQIVSLIWTIADDVLRDVFLRGQYRDVILPMVVLRRLDALLEPTKDAVEEELKEQKAMGLDEIDEDAVKDITGLSYFNTSRWTLNRLKAQASDNNDLLYDNFVESTQQLFKYRTHAMIGKSRKSQSVRILLVLVSQVYTMVCDALNHREQPIIVS